MKTAGHRKEWDEILDIGKGGFRVGEEEMVDFFAEVWNGGIEQWVLHGRRRQLSLVMAVAKKMGRYGRQMEAHLKIISPLLETLAHDEDEIAIREADRFDDWFYKKDDALVRELLDFMRRNRTASRNSAIASEILSVAKDLMPKTAFDRALAQAFGEAAVGLVNFHAAVSRNRGIPNDVKRKADKHIQDAIESLDEAEMALDKYI